MAPASALLHQLLVQLELLFSVSAALEDERLGSTSVTLVTATLTNLVLLPAILISTSLYKNSRLGAKNSSSSIEIS
jgi:hypothetical protein